MRVGDRVEWGGVGLEIGSGVRARVKMGGRVGS